MNGGASWDGELGDSALEGHGSGGDGWSNLSRWACQMIIEVIYGQRFWLGWLRFKSLKMLGL